MTWNKRKCYTLLQSESTAVSNKSVRETATLSIRLLYTVSSSFNQLSHYYYIPASVQVCRSQGVWGHAPTPIKKILKQDGKNTRVLLSWTACLYCNYVQITYIHTYIISASWPLPFLQSLRNEQARTNIQNKSGQVWLNQQSSPTIYVFALLICTLGQLQPSPEQTSYSHFFFQH